MERRHQLACREAREDSGGQRKCKRQPNQAKAVWRDGLRRYARRVDNAELRSARVLYVLAHRSRFASSEEALISLFLHVVIAVELHILGLDLRNKLRLALQGFLL